MEKERDPVRAFLGSYWELRRDVQRMEEKIADLEALCYRATAQLTGMPGGGGGGSKATWDTLADARSKALDTLRAAVERCEEIEGFIDRVPDPVHRKLLQYKYIDGLTFTQIGEKMHYSERHTRKIRDRAMDAAREVWKSLFGEEETGDGMVSAD